MKKFQDLIGQFYYRTFVNSEFLESFAIKDSKQNEKIKRLFYKLRRMIENHKFTKRQEEVLLLLLGYKKSPLISKNFIGPRKFSEIAKLLKVSKANITQIIKTIRKRLENEEL